MDVKVTELLHAHGYSSFAELEAKIEQVLANDELAKWKEMTKEYGIPLLRNLDAGTNCTDPKVQTKPGSWHSELDSHDIRAGGCGNWCGSRRPGCVWGYRRHGCDRCQ